MKSFQIVSRIICKNIHRGHWACFMSRAAIGSKLNEEPAVWPPYIRVALCVLLHLASTLCRACLLCLHHYSGNSYTSAAETLQSHDLQDRVFIFAQCTVSFGMWCMTWAWKQLDEIKVNWVTKLGQVPTGRRKTHKFPEGTNQTLIKNLLLCLSFMYLCMQTHMNAPTIEEGSRCMCLGLCLSIRRILKFSRLRKYLRRVFEIQEQLWCVVLYSVQGW